MAMIGYEDSGGGETYPRRRAQAAPKVQATVQGARSGVAVPRPPAPGRDNPTVPDPTPEPEAPPAAPPYQADMSWYGDQGKLNDPNHKTAKYEIGRTLRGFDPTKGVNDEVLAALNKLGFGSFYGQGERLGLRGVTDVGRGAGLDPYDFEGDFVKDYGPGGANQWQYDYWKDPNAQSETPAVPPFDFSQLFPPQQPQAPATINVNSPGLDPGLLQALTAALSRSATPMYQAPASPMPQTQAPPMASGGSGAPSMAGAVQTQTAASSPLGMDPFMMWLQSQGYGGQ